MSNIPTQTKLRLKPHVRYFLRYTYFINIILLTIFTLLARQDQAVFASLDKAGGTAGLYHGLQISTFFNSKIDTDFTLEQLALNIAVCHWQE